MSVNRLDLRGFSYLEVAISVTIVGTLGLWFHSRLDPFVGRAVDVRVRVAMEGYRLAATRYAFNHGGRTPVDERSLISYLQKKADLDPARWTGRGGSGTVAFGEESGVRLVDNQGRPAAGLDALGRRYADYRR